MKVNFYFTLKFDQNRWNNTFDFQVYCQESDDGNFWATIFGEATLGGCIEEDVQRPGSGRPGSGGPDNGGLGSGGPGSGGPGNGGPGSGGPGNGGPGNGGPGNDGPSNGRPGNGGSGNGGPGNGGPGNGGPGNGGPGTGGPGNGGPGNGVTRPAIPEKPADCKCPKFPLKPKQIKTGIQYEYVQNDGKLKDY